MQPILPVPQKGEAGSLKGVVPLASFCPGVKWWVTLQECRVGSYPSTDQTGLVKSVSVLNRL